MPSTPSVCHKRGLIRRVGTSQMIAVMKIRALEIFKKLRTHPDSHMWELLDYDPKLIDRYKRSKNQLACSVGLQIPYGNFFLFRWHFFSNSKDKEEKTAKHRGEHSLIIEGTFPDKRTTTMIRIKDKFVIKRFTPRAEPASASTTNACCIVWGSCTKRFLANFGLALLVCVFER